MKYLKWALIIWSIGVTLIIVLAMVAIKSKPVTETHVFCAYGRIFVEFEEDGKRWGTIMLDYNGKPVPCRDDEDIKVENTI